VKKLIKLCIFCVLMFLSLEVSAQVLTGTYPAEERNSIYIIGNPYMYPIEYYNSDTGEFEGVMPLLLSKISERIGIDFTYFYDSKETGKEMRDKLKAEMVSASYRNFNENYYPDMISVVSYVDDGRKVSAGWDMTEYADAELVSTIKKEVDRLTEEEINSAILEYSVQNQDVMDKTARIIMYFLVALVVIVGVQPFFKKNTEEEVPENIDPVTRIGNLLHFEKSFSLRSSRLNFVAYIIVDSNYLQVYHNEQSITSAVKYIADALTEYASHDDIVSRITENGFAFVFGSEDDDSAKKHIEELINILSVYLEKDREEGVPYFRVALYHLNEDDNNCDTLLFNLRKNCAKLIGKDVYLEVCHKDMMIKEQERKDLLEDIANGFRNKEFKSYLQFIVDSKDKKIVSCEALSRWDRGEKGTFLPGVYIDVMEKSGTITQLDYYMFEQVCMQLHKWNDTIFDSISISCNITRITLSEEGFSDRISEISNRYVFDKSKLIIEITEDAIERNLEIAIGNILKCKNLGFAIALDDFGSGYTSLTNLCDYPIDIVKIDRSILRKADTKRGKDLFAGIVSLSHNLGLKIVCEGVEDEASSEYVSNLGCDYIQGWYYFKPSPIEVCEEIYQNLMK